MNKSKTIIEGPVTLRELKSDIYNKWVYIFGDVHHHNIQCPEGVIPTIHITNFIIKTIKDNPDKIIDLFIETSFINKSMPTRELHADSYLMDVTNSLKECLNINKDNCPYKNVRVHYTDVRIYLGHIFIQFLHWSKHTDEEIMRSDLNRKSKGKYIIDHIKDAMNMLEPKKIMDQTKILKQLNNIEDEDLKIKLYHYFLNTLEIKYIPLMSIYDDFLKSRTISDYKNYIKLTIVYIASLLDYYIVSRMFRTFNKGSTPRYIMMYLGDFHAKNIGQILRYLDSNIYRKLKMSFLMKYNGSVQCLDATDLIPFFNIYPNGESRLDYKRRLEFIKGIQKFMSDNGAKIWASYWEPYKEQDVHFTLINILKSDVIIVPNDSFLKFITRKLKRGILSENMSEDSLGRTLFWTNYLRQTYDNDSLERTKYKSISGLSNANIEINHLNDRIYPIGEKIPIETIVSYSVPYYDNHKSSLKVMIIDAILTTEELNKQILK